MIEFILGFILGVGFCICGAIVYLTRGERE